MSQSNSRPSFPKPAWTPWDLKKLRIYGKPWYANNRSKAPLISLHVVNGNPRLRMYMNKDSGETRSVPIAFDPIIFSGFIEACIEISNKPEPDRISFQIKASFDKNVKLDKPMITSLVSVGRGSTGVCYLSVQPRGEAQAIFEFNPNFFADMVGGDGERLDSVRASSLCLRGWAKLLFNTFCSYLAVKVTDPEAGKSSSSQSYGGGNSESYNSPDTSYQKSKKQDGFDAFDDDIPF